MHIIHTCTSKGVHVRINDHSIIKTAFYLFKCMSGRHQGQISPCQHNCLFTFQRSFVSILPRERLERCISCKPTYTAGTDRSGRARESFTLNVDANYCKLHTPSLPQFLLPSVGSSLPIAPKRTVHQSHTDRV